MGVVGGVYCFSGALNQKKNHNGGKRPAREGVVNERIIHKGEEERVKKNRLDCDYFHPRNASS